MSGVGMLALGAPFLVVLGIPLAILHNATIGRARRRRRHRRWLADRQEYVRLTGWIADLKGRPPGVTTLTRNRSGVVTVVPPRELGGRLTAKHRRV